MLYAIEAVENTYQGLHGVCNQIVVELDSFEEACEYGRQASEDLICSFGLEPEPDEGSEEEWTEDDYEDAWAEAISYSVWVVPDSKGNTIEELNDLFYNDPSGFIREFCEDC